MTEGVQKPASPSRKRLLPHDVRCDVQATPAPEKDPAGSAHGPPLQDTTAKACTPPTPNKMASAADTAVVMSNSSTVGATPTKRRKLKSPEKDEHRIQKEDEKRMKKEAAEKARAEARRAKDEESRRKQELAEAKRREMEVEMEKKAKAQPNLTQWFSMKVKKSSPVVPAVSGEGSANHFEPPAPQNKVKSDYERTFLSYEVKPHEKLAPECLFWANSSDCEKKAAIAKLDSMAANQNTTNVPPNEQPWRAGQCRRGSRYLRVKDIVSRLQGSSDQPVDQLEECSENKMRQLLEALRTTPMKYIHFTQDARPPYCGTFTKLQQCRRLAINPFTKALPETDYDYDSECEWEELDEGEDLDAEDEDDFDSEGADDLEDFLENDDEVAQSKRRLITGDLEPFCTGLLWEDSNGVLRKADGSVDEQTTFSEYRMGILLDPPPTSIDPFSTGLWEDESHPTTSVVAKDTSDLMPPPSRLPIHARPEDGAKLSAKQTGGSTENVTKPTKRTVPNECLGEFKAAISGSDLTKIALVEALKKQFPKIPKDAITNTLPLVAIRTGPKAAEKRWSLLDT